MQVERWRWRHSNPTCGNQIHLNFLHSEAMGMLEHLAHAFALLTPYIVKIPLPNIKFLPPANEVAGR